MNDDADQAPAGADGLVFLPYMMGERSPVWDPYARGVFFGLSLKTTRREMNRAVLGVCAADAELPPDEGAVACPLDAAGSFGRMNESSAWRRPTSVM